MAFSSNAIVWEADSTLSTAITGATAAQSDGNFSVASTNATITQIDNSSLKANYYKVEIEITYSSAPDAGSNIDIYIMDDDTDIASDTAVLAPTTTAKRGARQVGSVQVANTTSQQRVTTIIPTFGLNKFKLSVYNDTGQSLPTGWTLKVKSLAQIPVA